MAREHVTESSMVDRRRGGEMKSGEVIDSVQVDN
jgi:hypothetical protein